jgi:MFS transporter, DHA1 family, tetracycline resistance protein
MTQKRILGVVFLTVFMDLLGFGIIIPVQPFYAETLGASPTIITLLGASYSLMQFLFAPFWGKLSDRIGRRPVMLVSVATSAAGYALFGLSGSLGLLFFARMLAGLGGANIGTAQAIIADSTDAASRAKGMGVIGAAFGLGFTLGPAIGGYFSRYGLHVPALVAAGLAGMNWLAACFFLPETYPAERRGKGESHRSPLSLAALRHAARHRNVGTLLTIGLVFTAAFSLLEQVLGLFIGYVWAREPGVAATTESLRHAAMLTSYVLIAVGITAIVVQGGLIGKLARRFGEGRLLKVGLTFVAAGLLAIPLAGQLGSYLFLMLVCSWIAMGSGMSNPSLVSLLSQSVNADEQGTTLGLAQSLSALGRVIGPSVAGWLFEMGIGLPFWIGGGLTLVCVLIALRLPGRAGAKLSTAR